MTARMLWRRARKYLPLILLPFMFGVKAHGERLKVYPPTPSVGPRSNVRPEPIWLDRPVHLKLIPRITPYETTRRGITKETPVVSLGFNGVDGTDKGFGLFIPPDTHMAVGKGEGPSGRVVMVTNSGIQIWDKDGVPLTSPVPLQVFSGASDVFDPRVIYDQHSDRFFIMLLEGSSPNPGGLSNVHIAVSSDHLPSNLTTDWVLLSGSALGQIGGTEAWFDYPAIGADENSVFVTGNMFDQFGFFVGVKIRVFDKNALISGSYRFRDVDIPLTGTDGIFSLQPAHTYGTTASGNFYLISTESPFTGRFVEIAGAPDNPYILRDSTLIWNIGDAVNGAPQQGSSVVLDTLSPRAMDAVYRDGHVWCTFTTDPDSDGRSEVVWVDVATNGGGGNSPTLAGSGYIDGSAPEAWTFMPSIAVNERGDVAICFTQSSPNQFPDMRYVTRLVSDPPGTFQEHQVAANSAGPYDSFMLPGLRFADRWGDYSACVVDPQDEFTFWAANEVVIVSATDSSIWGTFIAKLGPVDPNVTPIPRDTPTPGPTKTPLPSLNALLWGAQPNEERIVILNPDTGEEVGSFEGPEEAPIHSNNFNIGLAIGFNGQSLFYTNGDTQPGIIYELDPFTGEVKSQSDPGRWFGRGGIADELPTYGSLGFVRPPSDAENVFLFLIHSAFTLGGDLHKVRLPTEEEAAVWENARLRDNLFGFSPANAVGADNTEDLWVFDPGIGSSSFEAPTFVHVDPVPSGRGIGFLAAPNQTIVGMAYDGRRLFASDLNGLIFIIDTETGVSTRAPLRVEGGPLMALAVGNNVRQTPTPTLTPIPSSTPTRTPTYTTIPTAAFSFTPGPSPTSTPTPNPASPTQPTPRVTITTDNVGVEADPVWVTVGDLDNRNNEDIVTANRNADALSILYNRGDGSFTGHEKKDLGEGVKPSFVTIGDLDNDGWKDLIVLSLGKNQVLGLRNDNGSGFAEAVALNVDVQRPVSAFLGDLDGDDRDDLAVANSQTDSLTIVINPGGAKGLFAAAPSAATLDVGGTLPSSVVGGHLRPGGTTFDLVTANFGSDSISVFLGRGDGTFQDPAVYSVGINPRNITIADIDGANGNDIVVADYGAPQLAEPVSGHIVVLYNDGTGRFSPETAASTIDLDNNPIALVPVDFDQDCDIDLAVVNFGFPAPFPNNPQPGDLLIVYNDLGEGSFNGPNTPPFDRIESIGFRPLSLAAGGFDSSRRDDLAVAIQAEAAVGVLLVNNVTVRCASFCDFNGDGVCNDEDLFLIAAAQSHEDRRIRILADSNSDGLLNEEDLINYIKLRRESLGIKVSRMRKARFRSPEIPKSSNPAVDSDINGDGVVDFQDLFPSD